MVQFSNRDTRNSIDIKIYFQCFDTRMACILQPECHFLHGYFRCHLLVEAVDMEVRITSLQGTHIFRRDRTSQLIKCTPWSTRLCPHTTIIKKMQTFLELEGKLGPKPQALRNQFRPSQQDTNPELGKMARLQKRERGQHLQKNLKLQQGLILIR